MSYEETTNISKNAELPPSYDARVNWFRREDQARDWVAFTAIEPQRRGPLLKSRLTDDALAHRELSENERLVDPDNGLGFFLHSYAATSQRTPGTHAFTDFSTTREETMKS